MVAATQLPMAMASVIAIRETHISPLLSPVPTTRALLTSEMAPPVGLKTALERGSNWLVPDVPGKAY
jgi:hypothetical protein